jgi:DNA repair photolyase
MVNQDIGNVNVPLKAIYRPNGEALEYAAYGLNLYGGCSHGCKYCYNQYRFRRSCNSLLKKATLENIEADLNVIKSDIEPVHLSFVGDPYDMGRKDNDYTRPVLGLFRKYDHPFQVLTKGGLNAARDFDLYGSDDRFGVTLTFINPEDSNEWEPGAALPKERMEALKIAHEQGIKTWVSLEPVIDPQQTLALIDVTHEFVDFYGVGKLNHDARANNINWLKFRADAESLLKRLGKAYKIKAALGAVV